MTSFPTPLPRSLSFVNVSNLLTKICQLLQINNEVVRLQRAQTRAGSAERLAAPISSHFHHQTLANPTQSQLRPTTTEEKPAAMIRQQGIHLHWQTVQIADVLAEFVFGKW